jgi:threonine dehydrogenase-like Zn-dependent dehydrogenase
VYKADISIRMVFGRCSVRTFLPEAIRLLKANLDLFETFVEAIVSVEDAAEYYTRFEKGDIGKVAFRMS